MVQTPVDNGFNSVTKEFFFRELEAISIPKSVREVALQMEVSIDVRVISRLDYMNFKSYPANSFYGYAVLVFYDYVTRIVPIRFGRNTLYFERNESAYGLWESFKATGWNGFFASNIAQEVAELAVALSLTVTPAPPVSVDWQGFSELPLREVYIRTPFGTSFSLETTYERALAFQDANGTVTQPKSKRADNPKKDKGLPPNGIQPANAPNSDQPYGGTKPPSTPAELGDWFNPKLPSSADSGLGLDKPNPENIPTSPTIRLLATGSFYSGNQGCQNDSPQTATKDIPSSELDSPYTVVYTPVLGGQECPNRFTVQVKGASGAFVSFGNTCFDSNNCSKVGQGGVVLTWFFN